MKYYTMHNKLKKILEKNYKGYSCLLLIFLTAELLTL